MNIILLTILLTLLGAGLVILLVWLGVSSCKLMGFKRKTILRFDKLDEELKNVQVYFENKYNDETEYLNTKIEDVYEKMGKEFEELHRGILTDMYKKIDDNMKENNRCFDDLERSIDSRLDKFYNSLKTKNDTTK